MEVIFERTGERRYSVTAVPETFPAVTMNPAPGYDELLPHDLVHLVAEELLGLRLGVFGQLSRGGHAGTFRLAEACGTTRDKARARRAFNKRGARQQREGAHDSELSEAVAAVCHRAWISSRKRPSSSDHDERLAEKLSTLLQRSVRRVRAEEILRALDDLSARWRSLSVGERLTLSWPSE